MRRLKEDQQRILDSVGYRPTAKANLLTLIDGINYIKTDRWHKPAAAVDYTIHVQWRVGNFLMVLNAARAAPASAFT